MVWNDEKNEKQNKQITKEYFSYMATIKVLHADKPQKVYGDHSMSVLTFRSILL